MESIILRKVIYFFLLICSLDPIGAKADVSFDCRTAKVTAEKLVCDNKTLSDLDGELGRIYRLIMHGKNASIADKKILKASQRGWIKGRNDCWKSVSELTCILSSYVVRISELRIGYVDARKIKETNLSYGPIGLTCEGTKEQFWITQLHTNERFATVIGGSYIFVLSQVPTASGVKYQSQTDDVRASLWIKADVTVFQIRDGIAWNCTTFSP